MIMLFRTSAIMTNCKKYCMKQKLNLLKDIPYSSITSPTIRSNVVKKYLHEILTNAIFNYTPCKDLMQFMEEKHKPSSKKWANISKKWLSLSAKPYPNVSEGVSNYL